METLNQALCSARRRQAGRVVYRVQMCRSAQASWQIEARADVILFFIDYLIKTFFYWILDQYSCRCDTGVIAAPSF